MRAAAVIILSLILGTVAFSACARAPAGQCEPSAYPQQLSVRVSGRARVESLAVLDSALFKTCHDTAEPYRGWQGSAYVVQWPGTYFESRFTGNEVEIDINAAGGRYNVFVDGQMQLSRNNSGSQTYTFSDLGEGEHTLRLEMASEQAASPVRFGGFIVPAANVRPAPPPRARQIEIIGDSYAAGYGTTSTKRECPQEEIRLTTDTQQAFGALLGKHYDADYQINAVSGIGMVRNYGGGTGNVMPDLYPYTLFDKSVVYEDPSWQPQVVVIALGDNDFATPLASGEKWASAEALRNDFISTYVAFVQSVRARHPKATFVLMDFNEDALPGYLADIADKLKAAGETRVLLYHPGGGAFEQTGCDWHLSLNDHQRLANGLEALINSHPDIWSKNEQGQ